MDGASGGWVGVRRGLGVWGYGRGCPVCERGLWGWVLVAAGLVSPLVLFVAIVFGQAAGGGGDINPWAQLGIGALVAAPAYGAVTVLWQQSRAKDKVIAAKDDRIIALQEDRVARERLLNERLAPQLAQAADLLSRTPRAVDRTLQEAASSASGVTSVQLQDVLGALREVTRQLSERPER